MIFEILAMAKNGVIGKNNSMPWHLPNDFKYFKKTTMGYPIVMGRKTWESIGARPLPGRENVVLTSAVGENKAELEEQGCVVFNSIDEVVKHFAEKDFFVIGGGRIYEQFLPITDRLYITMIDEEFDGDTKFCNPTLDGWKLVSATEGEVDEKNVYKHSFNIYERCL